MEIKANSHLNQSNSQPPLSLLPRSGWESEITFLRVILKAKQALDRVEQELD